GPRIANRDGEDAGPLRCRGDRRRRKLLPGLAEAFEVAEEECPVFDNRTAEDAAVLVAIEGRLLTAGRRKESGRVQTRIAIELPDAALERVAAALVSDVDRRTGGAAVLGALVGRYDLELADRVRGRLHHLVAEALVAGAVGVVVDAVDEEVVEHAPEAVDVQRPFAIGARTAAVEVGCAHSRRQQRERRVLAPIEREGDDLRSADDL